jgi:hypothetical protein
MASYLTTHHGEEQAMPTERKVLLAEGAGGGTASIRFDADTYRDDMNYWRAWCWDHRRRFRRDLMAQRAGFLVRMEALGVGECVGTHHPNCARVRWPNSLFPCDGGAR